MVQNTKKGMDESLNKKGSVAGKDRDEDEKMNRNADKSSPKKPDTSSSSRKSR